MNKSFNVSRYSINIEAQNDLNKITILLNDNEKSKGWAARRDIFEHEYDDPVDDAMDIEDDLISDKDKYSR